jgi:hypothetical protein
METGDTEALDGALTALAERSREAARADGLAAVPVLTDIDYRGKPIAMGVALYGAEDVSATSFAFAGGGFDREGFGATYLTNEDGESLGGSLRSVLIVRQPKLSRAEQALLDRLPAADLNATVAPPYATTIFVVAVTLTSGAFPFQDPALSEAIRTRLPHLEWPPRDPPVRAEDADARLRAWLESSEHMGELEALEARAAVEELVRLRQGILTGFR